MSALRLFESTRPHLLPTRYLSRGGCVASIPPIAIPAGLWLCTVFTDTVQIEVGARAILISPEDWDSLLRTGEVRPG